MGVAKDENDVGLVAAEEVEKSMVLFSELAGADVMLSTELAGTEVMNVSGGVVEMLRKLREIGEIFDVVLWNVNIEAVEDMLELDTRLVRVDTRMLDEVRVDEDVLVEDEARNDEVVLELDDDLELDDVKRTEPVERLEMIDEEGLGSSRLLEAGK